ncbi:MAG: hypothetical protein D6743_16020, partial [Calditrichaeota bacterium]
KALPAENDSGRGAQASVTKTGKQAGEIYMTIINGCCNSAVLTDTSPLARRATALLLPTLAFCMLASAALAAEVRVSWDPNKESDLMGYRVYYGTKSRQERRYDESIFVGNVTSYRVRGLKAGQTYFFAVTALDFAGNESGFSEEVSIQVSGSGNDSEETSGKQAIAALAYNFPNPFDPKVERTTIRFELREDAEVTIEILDLGTQLVETLAKDEFRPRGVYEVDAWDGRNKNGNFVANGVYYCSIRTARQQRLIKIAVMRSAN